MNKEQASQQALDQLYQESGAPQFLSAVFLISVILITGWIIYRYQKRNAAKQQVQKDILAELKKQNRAVN